MSNLYIAAFHNGVMGMCCHHQLGWWWCIQQMHCGKKRQKMACFGYPLSAASNIM